MPNSQPMAGHRIDVRCLGQFVVAVDGVEAVPCRPGKARALFQHLLVRHGQVVQTKQLAEVLWPGCTPAKVATSLRVAVHTLRGDLHATLGTPEASLQVKHASGGYLLAGDGIRLDVEEFERSVSEAQRSSSPDQALPSWRRAAALYAGDFLPFDDGDWVEGCREWHRSRAAWAFTALQGDAARRGDVPALLHWCRRLLALDPCDEQVYRSLMALHAQRGERGQVQRWFDLCRRRLADLGVDVDAQTVAVYHHALRPRSQPP